MKNHPNAKWAIMLAAVGIMSSVHAAPALGPTGHYYDVFDGPSISWDDANVAANASSYLGLPGHLVTITGAIEDSFIDGLRDSLGFGQVWAGGFQDPVAETDPLAGWTWVNGEGTFPGVDSASPYADWGGGEPNDAAGPGSEQHSSIGRFGLGGGWNDEGAAPSLITGYAVEYERKSVPDQGPLPVITALCLFGFLAAHRLSIRSHEA